MRNSAAASRRLRLVSISPSQLVRTDTINGIAQCTEMPSEKCTVSCYEQQLHCKEVRRCSWDTSHWRLPLKNRLPGFPWERCSWPPSFLICLWPAFLLLGVEHARVAPGITRVTPLDFYDYPYTHSLLMAMRLGSSLLRHLFSAAPPRTIGAHSRRSGVSHWVLDLIVHRPDLPLAPGSHSYFGLGLWNSVAGTLMVETASVRCGRAHLHPDDSGQESRRTFRILGTRPGSVRHRLSECIWASTAGHARSGMGWYGHVGVCVMGMVAGPQP